MASTITNLTRPDKAGGDPGSPVFFDILKFDLKDDYNAAGLLNFSTMVAAALGAGKTIIGVFAVNCKGLVPYYIKADDTVIFQWLESSAGADGPLIVVPTGDMALYTNLELGVVSY